VTDVRRVAVVATSLMLVVAGVLMTATVAGAQAPTTTLVPIDEQPINSPSIIPEPNSTSQPTQYVVMIAVLLGLAAIALLVYRESRKKAGNRTHKPA